jgi:hypothetical protein
MKPQTPNKPRAPPPQVVTEVIGVFANDGEHVCTRKPLGVADGCVPDAAVAPNGTAALLMPGVSPRAGGRKGAAGRVYLLSFRARVPATGLSCVGLAPVCVARPASRQQAPACEPFSATSTVRVATRCAGVSQSLASALKQQALELQAAP